MNDYFGKVTSDQDLIKRILTKIPGFNGYVERLNRRSSDKLLREFVAEKYHDLEQRVSAVQRELINQGQIESVDDLESAAIKLRQFSDRVRRATYGYSSLFEATKINEKELARVYQYDLTLVDNIDEISHAIDNVEASIGTDGFPASVRHLTTLAQDSVDAFNQRTQVFMESVDDTSQ
jgi:hypothetical protein